MKKLFLVFISFASLAGCRYFVPDPPCPPPPSAKIPITPTYSCIQQTVAPVLPPCNETLSLVELVDIALQNSPKTRATWYRAKAAAADVGIARGAYLPPVTFLGQYLNQRFLTADDQGNKFVFDQVTYGPNLSTSYLLFDFGGRIGNLQEALFALNSLNWTYNWDVQTVMIEVIQNYYNYANAISILKVSEENVKINEATVEVTHALRKGGVKNLADELQARTNLMQSQIQVEKDRGFMNIARATLAQSVGLTADTPLSIAELPEKFALEGVCQDMNAVLEAAKANRADLMALRAIVLENRAQIKAVRSNFFPTLTTQATGGKQWLFGQGPDTVWSFALNLNYSLFNSFIDTNLLEKAKSELAQAQAILDEEELAAFLTVLTDYFLFLANTEILKTSYKYVKVASKNQEVASAYYKAGLNTIIEVLAANNALNEARVQLANAKTDWLTSLANLAYNTGGLSASAIQPNQKVMPSLLEFEVTDEDYDKVEFD